MTNDQHPLTMKTILIIEDEPEMRRNLATILRLVKYHPQVLSSPATQ